MSEFVFVSSYDLILETIGLNFMLYSFELFLMYKISYTEKNVLEIPPGVITELGIGAEYQ